jgi:serine/threonine-protein kinase
VSGVPERIGKYRIVEAIGRGGMGSVYKAHDPLLDRMVAIKVMAEGTDTGEESRIRFLREAQSAARLNHANIITIYELGEDQGRIFIVMELLAGEPLSRSIGRVPPLPLRRRLTLMLQMCEGLAFAHQHGVIHRDIKPGNIFLLGTGQVKILDFGIARLASSELTRTGMLMGTPSYMSPEQARGQRSDARSDIFSLGVVFYEFLSGQKPFPGDDYFEILEKLRSLEPRSLRELAPTLPPALVGAVHRMLAKDPEARYQSLEALRADLALLPDPLPADSTADLREAVDRSFAEVARLQRMLVSSVGAAALGEETLAAGDAVAGGGGLEATLQTLERETDRLRTLARTVERLDAMVARGVAAFERNDLDGATAALDAVLREMPEHQRAREYRERARLEQMRQRTFRSLEAVPPTAGPSADGPTLPAGDVAPVSQGAGRTAGTSGTVRGPGEVPPSPGTVTPPGRTIPPPTSRRWLPLVAAGGLALGAALGGYVLVFRPSAPPPPSTPVEQPAPPPPVAPAPGADTNVSVRPPAGKSPAPRPQLTPEQSKVIEDALTLAQLFQTRGDNERALREYRRVLALDPTHTEARRGATETERALKAKR